MLGTPKKYNSNIFNLCRVLKCFQLKRVKEWLSIRNAHKTDDRIEDEKGIWKGKDGRAGYLYVCVYVYIYQHLGDPDPLYSSPFHRKFATVYKSVRTICVWRF